MLRTSGVVDDAILSIIGPANTTHAGPVAVPRWAGGDTGPPNRGGKGRGQAPKIFWPRTARVQDVAVYSE